MKSLPFDIIDLYIQAELQSLLGAPERTMQHCWGNCTHRCRNAFTQVLKISNLHLVHPSYDVIPCKKSPKTLNQASILPGTVVSLVQFSVLGTSH